MNKPFSYQRIKAYALTRCLYHECTVQFAANTNVKLSAILFASGGNRYRLVMLTVAFHCPIPCDFKFPERFFRGFSKG